MKVTALAPSAPAAWDAPQPQPGSAPAGPIGRRVLGSSKVLPRSPLRLPAAAAALVAAAAHLPVIPDHLSEAPYVGWLFVGLSAVCVLGAVALVVDDSILVWAGLGSTCGAAVAGYLLSRGPGLPAMADDIGDWSNRLGLISVTTETLVAVLAVTVLRSRARTTVPGRVARRAAWVVPAAAVILALGTYPLGWIAA